MPWQGPGKCSTPGCGGHAPPGKGQCPRCRRRSRATRARIDATYSDPRWRELSAAYLAAYPRCQSDTTGGCPRPATDVHHVDGKGPSGPRGLDWSNLAALCKSHHSQITAAATGFHRRR